MVNNLVIVGAVVFIVIFTLAVILPAVFSNPALGCAKLSGYDASSPKDSTGWAKICLEYPFKRS